MLHCQILASVDLPVEAFLPQVGIQSSLLFLRRKSIQEMDSDVIGNAKDYSVFMAIADMVGHDRRGNPLYLRDSDGIELIFPTKRTTLRRVRNRLLPVEMSIFEKKLDDDLPQIGKSYLSFKANGGILE
jgi:type I restriction enzyme M protein